MCNKRERATVQGVRPCHFFIHIYIYIIYLFYFSYLGLCWVFVAAHRLSLVAGSGGYSPVAACGLSLQWLLLFQSMGCRARGLQ